MKIEVRQAPVFIDTIPVRVIQAEQDDKYFPPEPAEADDDQS